MDIYQIIGSLKYLEGAKGTHPSTSEIAEEAGCAEATCIKYLKKAVGKGLIVQRDGKYMTLAVARVFDEQKQDSK